MDWQQTGSEVGLATSSPFTPSPRLARRLALFDARRYPVGQCGKIGKSTHGGGTASLVS